MSIMQRETRIKTAYRNPEQPGALGGVERLQSHAFKTTSKKKIQSTLLEDDTYARHAPIRRNFRRNPIMAYGIDDCWQADLADLSSLAESNGKHRYLLTVIDVLSKYAWVRPLKDKYGKSMMKAFSMILKEGRKPRNLTTDQGKEFVNREFQAFLKQHEINFFAAVNDTKAAVVERFNRTLKSKMWRYFTSTSKFRYIGVLQDLIKAYNHTQHRSIAGLRPVDVNRRNERDVWYYLYLRRAPKKVKGPRFAIGDQVRISRYKTEFEKGYLPNWTSEVFTVHRIIPLGYLGASEYVYQLRDQHGDVIVGTFYEAQMLPYGAVSK